MKYLFLDTNIYLHYKDFEEIPWKQIVGTDDDVTIVVVPIVQDEIDLKKDFSKGKIQKRAKKYSSKLYEILMNGRACKLKILRCEEPVPTKEDSELFDLSRNDNRIILAALKSTFDNRDIVIISGDKNIQFKAKDHSLGHILMPDEYRLHEEDSSSDSQTSSEKQSNESNVACSPKPILAFRGELLSLQIQRPSCIDIDQEINTRLKQTIEELPELKYEERSFDPNKVLDFLSKPFLTQDQVDRYNEERKEYLKEAESMHRVETEKLFMDSRFKKITFEVVNIGKAPTGEMMIFIQTPENVKLYSCKESKDFKEYSEPIKPSIIGYNRELSKSLVLATRGYKPTGEWIWNPGKVLSRNKFSEHQDYLLQQLKREIDTSFYIDALNCDSFTLNWKIIDAMTPEPVIGSLDVIIEN